MTTNAVIIHEICDIQDRLIDLLKHLKNEEQKRLLLACINPIPKFIASFE